MVHQEDGSYERESEQEKGISMFRGNSSGKCVNTGKDAEDLGEEM